MKQIESIYFNVIALCAIMLLCMPTQSIAQGITNKNITAGIEKSPGYYDETVRRYFRNSQWAAGKKLLDEGMKEYSYLSALNELMGLYYYQFKQYDKARFYLINSLKDDESNHQAREILVKVEEETKNYSSAIVYVNELLEVSPYSEHWWRKKINLYRYLGNDDEADRLLERLCGIYPENERIKKDWAYRMETKYRQQHKVENSQSQIQDLRQLIELNPKDPEYYLSLSNLLLQTGHDSEAAEVAGEGAMSCPNSSALIEKKVGILVGMNHFAEAVAYLNSFKSTSHSGLAAKLSKEIQMDAARASQMNDSYIQYAKVYDSEHSTEALTFLLNTSIARGYYDDALVYIGEAKKVYGAKPDLLYKEYLVNRRLGNVIKANGLLNKLYEINPKNEEVATELARINYDKAQEFMRYEQYEDAIPLLQMASSETVEKELRQSAMLRLFNSYLMAKDYNEALNALDKYNEKFGYNAYLQQKAKIYSEQGKTTLALELLKSGYIYTADSLKTGYSSAYEEIATPYIKSLISSGMLHAADEQIKQAIEMCQNSNDLLRMGITISQLLYDKKAVEQYVQVGRKNFPDDSFFIIKEAQTYQAKENYRTAIDLTLPLLETYIGDSTVVGTYAENCQLLALRYLRDKQLDKAMNLVDSALAIWPTHNEILYTKGLIYKEQRDWPNAYKYLKMYKPSSDELKAHLRLLNEMLNKGFQNNLTLEYQKARYGSQDKITANASASYTRKYILNEYTFDLNYLGRDGDTDAEEVSKDVSDLTTGGTGIMLGLQWKHNFSKKLNAYIKGACANKYFPKYTVKLGAAYDLNNDLNVNVDASWRRVESYLSVYSESDGTTQTGWKKTYKNLFMLTLGATKTYEMFTLAAGVDGFMLDNKYYVSGKAKVQFFPFEGDHSNIFANGGVGTAPESSIVDRSLPSVFDHLNTYVGVGAYYPVNQYLGVSVSGTWYTMYSQSEKILTGINETASSTGTSYINMFYINTSLTISF